MNTLTSPIPTTITLYKKTRRLKIEFDNGESFIFPCGYLRKASLSADNRQGESMQEFTEVNILAIEPVGNYAIKPLFSDGHATGIYSWQTLYELGKKMTP